MIKLSEQNKPSSPTLPALVLAGGLIAFLLTFSLMAPIYLSFLLTMLIALALNPFVSKLRTITGGRQGATGLVVLLLITVIGLSGWAFFNPLKDSVANFSELLPTYWERLQKPLIRMEQHAERTEMRMQAEVTSEIAELNRSEPANVPVHRGSFKRPVLDSSTPIDEVDSNTATASADTNTIRSSLAQMLRGVVGSFTKVAFNGAQMLVVLATVFFGVIFMLMDPRPVITALLLLVPETHHDRAVAIMNRICRFAPAWGGSTLAGMFTIGVLVFLLMWPILGMMDALVLGLIAGILESVPFLGPTLSTVPALLLALGKGGMTPLWVLLAYIGIQALENNVILPLIMSRGMKLHAVAVIFSMLVCVAAFGVLGVLVAAPLVAILRIVHDELYRKRLLPSVTDEELDLLSQRVLHEHSPSPT